MALPARFDLDDIYDSPYAHELRRGMSLLRFAPALERQYVRTHLIRVRLRVRVWVLLGLGLAALYTAIHVSQAGIYNLGALLCAALLALDLVAVWVAFGPHFERSYLRFAWLYVPLSGCAATLFITQAVSAGRFEQLVLLATTLVSVFFLSGALLRTTALTALLMLATFVGSGLLFGLGPELITGVLGLLGLTACVGAIVGWDIEKSYRMSFLESGLIGELAERDSLTGLKNRRAFDDHLAMVWQYGLRQRCSVALLLIDVDAFKRYNDRHGHQAGDEALRRVARLVGAYARRSLDFAARYGGEEFVIVLYDVSPVAVSHLAERLCRAVEQLRIPHADSPVAPVVTASIGAAVMRPAPGKEPARLFELADKALYTAKRSGRNRTVVLEEEHAFIVTGVFAKGSLRRKA